MHVRQCLMVKCIRKKMYMPKKISFCTVYSNEKLLWTHWDRCVKFWTVGMKVGS